MLRNIKNCLGPGLIILHDLTTKSYMRFDTWNVRSLYRAVSLTAAARELTRYKSDLVDVQEVTWDKEGTVKAGDYDFFYGKGTTIFSWE